MQAPLPALLTRRALLRRFTLLYAFNPDTKLPPVGRATFDTQHLSAQAWLVLGYVVLGQRAFRLDEVWLENCQDEEPLSG